ncbi:hypothetical protein MMC18_004681 [Xylographa bjoerkii]|nr:hypothetical protein [Xylographa bjoerkii]
MSSVRWSIMKDEAELSTWLLIGAGLQSLLVLFLPLYVAIVPTCLFLLFRITTVLLITQGLMKNPRFENVTTEKLWAVPPSQDGSPDGAPPQSNMVLFVVGARSNHALGRSAPIFKEMGKYFFAMWEEAEANREQYGYLGKTFPLISTELASGNVMITLSYWKSIEHLHAFARGPAHRKGWDWLNKVARHDQSLGIMHEVYSAPYGHWENVYANFRPFGFAQTKYLVPSGKEGSDGATELVGARIETKGARMGGMNTRLGRKEV